jgi:DNA modification methylase
MIDEVLNIDYSEGIKAVEDESVSMILTDPPYEVSRQTNFANGEETGRDVDRFRISMDFGKWDAQGAFDIKNMCRECYRVLKQSGYFVCFYDLWKISELRDACIEVGFNQLRFIEWVKTNPVPINSKLNYLTNAREIAVCAVKGNNPVFKSEYDNGIYNFPICHEEERFHVTQKPLNLFRSLILKHTNRDDIVLDCCIGSGTTAIAAIREKRHFIGFELNKEYYDKACERIKRELQQPMLDFK